MPGQEQPHTHPDYEQTFARIATILDVIAQEQLEYQRSLVRTATEWDRRLAEHIEHAKIRGAETTDKLDGLIQLMDRHLREK
jgi:hypothetical protein